MTFHGVGFRLYVENMYKIGLDWSSWTPCVSSEECIYPRTPDQWTPRFFLNCKTLHLHMIVCEIRLKSTCTNSHLGWQMIHCNCWSDFSFSSNDTICCVLEIMCLYLVQCASGVLCLKPGVCVSIADSINGLFVLFLNYAANYAFLNMQSCVKYCKHTF